MITQFLNDIQKKYNKYTTYIHNLSNFDSVYLIKSLYKKYKINTLFKQGKSISINSSLRIKHKGKIRTYNLKFNDCLLLLPLSLEELINSFSIETKKLPFPYKFIKKDKLQFEGRIPDYKYFYDSFDKEKYNEYLILAANYNNDWNLLNETKKYLHNDVKSLFNIIENFSKEVYELERVNITDSVSISSLALNIFLTNYYDSKKTPKYIPRKQQYVEIKQGYFGGRVEIFKNYGENLYAYDVNSLYSHVMLKDMPIGPIIKSTDPNLDNYFGFCYATVMVPDNTYNPVLPFRDEKGNVYNPTGN